MKKLALFAVVYCALWAALYGAFGLNIAGALYVLKFYVWAMLPLSCILLHPKVILEASKQPPQPIRSALGTVQSWSILGALVWYGHTFTAVAWAIDMFIVAVFRHGVKQAREKNEVPA